MHVISFENGIHIFITLCLGKNFKLMTTLFVCESFFCSVASFSVMHALCKLCQSFFYSFMILILFTFMQAHRITIIMEYNFSSYQACCHLESIQKIWDFEYIFLHNSESLLFPFRCHHVHVNHMCLRT